MFSPRVVTLTTDFGLTDAYVAVMKAVILGLAPQVRIVDITHEVRPQNVAGASFLLRAAYPYFPVDAIHLAIVDPGVGTSRRPIAVRAPHGVFVGPDNGIFAGALVDQKAVDVASGELLTGSAVELTQSRYWRQPVSQTFHGRDIFAPVAAHLALGVELCSFGPRLDALQPAPPQSPAREQGAVYGSIMHIDRFGNAITNISGDSVPASVTIEVGGRTVPGLATDYQHERLVAIVGSAGLIEIAARNGSAASMLGLRVGDPVMVRTGQ